MKKKTVAFIFTIFTVFILSACGTSIHEELQANDWEVVSNTGDSITAQFGTNTATLTGLLNFSVGYQYELNEDETEIRFYTTENDNEQYSYNDEPEEYTYTIEEQGENELVFTEYGSEDDENSTLTFTPMEESSEQ